MSDPLTPDEIEQRQSAVPAEDDDGSTYDDATDRPLTPDEIEQRQEVGWDDEDQPVE